MSAEFSPCGKYRYQLRRHIEPELFTAAKGALVIIGLNPSTADAHRDDPTIRRCITFARKWGHTSLIMVNLFAYRATDPEVMKIAVEPIGPENDKWLQTSCAEASLILCAWGCGGDHLKRAGRVVCTLAGKLRHRLYCLRRNADGSPMHPLYVPGDTMPIPFP